MTQSGFGQMLGMCTGGGLDFAELLRTAGVGVFESVPKGSIHWRGVGLA